MRAFYGEADYSLPQIPATRALGALLAEPPWGAIWLAENGATPVGYIVLTLGFSMEYGGLRGFVDDLYVLPRFRGRGIGAALLAVLRSGCADRGVRALHVEVGPEDLPARRLYERAGYRSSGRLLLSLPLVAAVHAPEL